MKLTAIIFTIILCFLIIYLGYIFVPPFFYDAGYNNQINNLVIIGHRGGAGLAPENTLECIAKGIEAGADIIEIDIHMTKDGHLIVCHDENLDRTTNGSGKIQDLTLSEIRNFKIKDANGNITDYDIPLLRDVLELINGQCCLLIEVKQPKRPYIGIEQKLLNEIDLYNALHWTIVQSFNDSILEKIHNLNPRIRLEKLFIFKFPGLPFIFDNGITFFSYDKYSYIRSFNIYYKSASIPFINDIHCHEKEVKIWTVNEVETCPTLPINGIITDRPDIWKK